MLISRESKLSAAHYIDGGGEILLFVSSLNEKPSSNLWENGLGEMCDLQQGEGGEQGDSLMPMLFSLGLHEALDFCSRHLLLVQSVPVSLF